VLAPIFVMWLGIGLSSKIAVAFFLVFMASFFAVAAGIHEVDRALVERARVQVAHRAALQVEVHVPLNPSAWRLLQHQHAEQGVHGEGQAGEQQAEV
jgi:NitT/TauT family transport system permease protein